MEKLFEVKKLVRAKNASDAIKKEKTAPVDSVVLQAEEDTHSTGFSLD